MLADLDLTLAALLGDAAVNPPMTGVDVSFRTPDKGFSVGESTLDLFQYGVRENRVLRDPEPIIELVGGNYVRRTPPLPVDCDYLVTAWSIDPADTAVATERGILADALLKLSRFPTIPATYLRGALVGQPFPVQIWVAQSDDGRSLGEFWTALGMPPRSSFHLMVTIAMDLGVQTPEGPPVTTREIDVAGEDVFAVGGVVRNAAGIVVGASVVLDGGASTTTDAGGRFRFSGLASGDHTLRATDAGAPPVDVPITVPAPAIDGYDITFPP